MSALLLVLAVEVLAAGAALVAWGRRAWRA